jgi:CHASE2 domain-containing sensor protein
MRLLFTYVLGLSLAWLGLLSLLAGLYAWPRDGVFLPLGVGLAVLLVAARLLLSLVRQYFPADSIDLTDLTDSSRFS